MIFRKSSPFHVVFLLASCAPHEVDAHIVGDRELRGLGDDADVYASLPIGETLVILVRGYEEMDLLAEKHYHGFEAMSGGQLV